MSAVPRTQAIDTALFMLKNKLEANFAPAFTAINGRPSSLSSHISTTPDCLKAWEAGPRQPGSRLVSHPIELECSPGPNKYDGHANNETQACDERTVGKKRQFANRTRTGCGTCRKRKKKCDEARPECNNCLRGNFECGGYGKEIPLSRNNAAKAAPRLLSQERLSSAAIPAHFVWCAPCNIMHIPHCEPSQKLNVESKASSGLETSRDRVVNAHEQGRKPLTPSVWYETCAKPQQHASDHRPLPPPRPHSPPVSHLTPQTATQLTKYVQLPPRAPADEVCPDDDHYASRLLPPIAPMLAAPSASSISHYPQPYLPPKSGKDKMLSGEPFLPNTAQLVDERNLSLQASFRFNNAVVRMDSGERGWHFERIVAAEWIYPRAGERRVTGHLGGGISVSAPFHCDYGYNISLGDNVIIGPGCQLLDSGRIAIGRNTKIGARVTISTLEEPIVTKSLKGSECTETAREVYIGENVYIGDGCIIEAGVCIGNNAIVRAGSVVVQDIPANCVAFGNPAKARQVDWEG